MIDVVTRIRAKVIESNTGCWLFTGCLVRGGYGHIRVAGRSRLVHRVMYEATYGPIPEGLHVDHLCRVRNCCRPDHLEAVTREVNLARSLPGQRGQYWGSVERSKTHCPAGHPYDEANTRRNAKGYRWCRACHRTRSLARYYARKEAKS